MITPTVGKTLIITAGLFFSVFLVLILFSPSLPFYPTLLNSPRSERVEIWSLRRIVEWRPCNWWLRGHPAALPAKSNGYLRVDCYGGLNQMRRDFCDGVGIARLLNATLVLPKFEAATYWNESSLMQTGLLVQRWNDLLKDLIQ